jgi:hypothetical protein
VRDGWIGVRSVKLRTLRRPIPNSCADEHQLGGSAAAIERERAVNGRTTRISGSLKMVAKEGSAQAFNPLQRISPLLCIGCGAVLITAGVFLHWLEAGQAFAFSSPSDAASIPASRLSEQTAGRKAAAEEAAARKAEAERKAKAAAELERLETEKAAAEKARRAMLADGATEAKARAEREELASRRAAVDEAHSAAIDAEEAWKRFYKPSATCRDAAASATVECVNEYIKAKREFEVRQTAERAKPR